MEALALDRGGNLMDYNINKETKLEVGDKLSDPAGNHFVVVAKRYNGTYSQYALEVMLDCVSGPRVGVVRWVSHWLAIGYKDETNEH